MISSILELYYYQWSLKRI